MAAKRKSHFDFTKEKTEKRLDRKTDRTDITTYASTLLIVPVVDSNTFIDLTVQR